MNYQNIKLVSSLITENYYNLIFVSKCLFQQVRINKNYLEYIYDYIENIQTTELQNIFTLKYFISLYNELTKLNHKFSNNIFNRLHNTHYYSYQLDLETIKELVSIRAISMKNLEIDFYINDEKNNNIIKYLIISDIYSKNKIISEICRHDNLKLLKYLVEEIDIKFTYNNSIIHCYSIQNKDMFKYIVSKIPKSSIDYRELLLTSVNSFTIYQFKYLIKEGYLDIDYDVIKKIVLMNHLDFVRYIVEERNININFDLFCEAIKSNCTWVVKYLYKKFKFDISGVKDELIEYILSNTEYDIYDSYSSDDDQPFCSDPIVVNGKEIFRNDKRRDILKFLTKDVNKNNDETFIRTSKNGYLDVVKLLIENGADIHDGE